MALTLKQMREEVRAGMGQDGDIEPRIDKALNLAQQRIARAHRFEELFVSTDLSTTASTQTLSLSSITNLDTIYSVVLVDSTSSRRLEKIQNRTWDKAIAQLQSTTEARPIYYSIWGTSTLQFLPTPDAVYTIRVKYSKWPADLTDDNTSSDLLNKEDLIIEYALHHLHKMSGNFDSADLHFRNFRNMLKEAIESDQFSPDGVIQPDFEHNYGSDYYLNPFIRSVRSWL